MCPFFCRMFHLFLVDSCTALEVAHFVPGLFVKSWCGMNVRKVSWAKLKKADVCTADLQERCAARNQQIPVETAFSTLLSTSIIHEVYLEINHTYNILQPFRSHTQSVVFAIDQPFVAELKTMDASSGLPSITITTIVPSIGSAAMEDLWQCALGFCSLDDLPNTAAASALLAGWEPIPNPNHRRFEVYYSN